MTSSKKSPRRKATGRRRIKQPLPERKTRERNVAGRRTTEQRVEADGELAERLPAETDIERAAVPPVRKGPTLCGD